MANGKRDQNLLERIHEKTPIESAMDISENRSDEILGSSEKNKYNIVDSKSDDRELKHNERKTFEGHLESDRIGHDDKRGYESNDESKIESRHGRRHESRYHKRHRNNHESRHENLDKVTFESKSESKSESKPDDERLFIGTDKSRLESSFESSFEISFESSFESRHLTREQTRSDSKQNTKHNIINVTGDHDNSEEISDYGDKKISPSNSGRFCIHIIVQYQDLTGKVQEGYLRKDTNSKVSRTPYLNNYNGIYS